MSSLTYSRRADRNTLPAIYEHVPALLSEEAALCVVELARCAYVQGNPQVVPVAREALATLTGIAECVLGDILTELDLSGLLVVRPEGILFDVRLVEPRLRVLRGNYR